MIAKIDDFLYSAKFLYNKNNADSSRYIVFIEKIRHFVENPPESVEKPL